MRFLKETRIEDAILIDPRVADVFQQHGMPCIGCLASSVETLENGCSMHNVDIEKLLKDLNELTGDDD